MKDRTTIIIAHRLATIRSADKIFVLKDGNIAESGTFDELSRNEGMFQHLLSLQFQPETHE